MAEDKDPLVDEEDESVEEDLVSEEELPESPALADNVVETHEVELSSGAGVTFVKEPSGKLTQVPTE